MADFGHEHSRFRVHAELMELISVLSPTMTVNMIISKAAALLRMLSNYLRSKK